MAMVATLEGVENGIYKVEIKPEVGTAYYREFSKKGLEEYIEQAEDYCKNKGYQFVYKDKVHNELLALHKKMYDVRWNGAKGDIEQLEREFMSLVDREGVDLEKVNEMFKNDMLPGHLKSNHGGKREGAGRPSLGTTKKVSITLPDEIWEMIEKRKETWGASQSQTLRMMIEGYFYKEDDDVDEDLL